jgi:hypothetical protein
VAAVGVEVTSGSGTWSSISDKNLKTNIEALNYSDILEKVKKLDVSKWSYITQTAKENKEYQNDIYHIGPMAQDFYSIFGLGEKETSINELDVTGVNTCAIKALIEMAEKQSAEIEALKKEVQSLKN